MVPQVGDIYEVTKDWNYIARTRVITGVGPLDISYTLVNTPKLNHSITFTEFNSCVRRRIWYLKVPTFLCIPPGA